MCVVTGHEMPVWTSVRAMDTAIRRDRAMVVAVTLARQ